MKAAHGSFTTMATFYPGPVAPMLGRVPEENGWEIGPSHGGVVQGGLEFDLPISSAGATTQPHPANVSPSSSSSPPATSSSTTTNTTLSTTASAATAIPRPLPVPTARAQSAHKPRPLSMPPQAYNTSPLTSSSDRDRQPMADQKHRQPRDGSTSKQSRSANRVLGDYTLTKTLGAGSMGKVKLAIHNVTEEKVRRPRNMPHAPPAHPRFSQLACYKNSSPRSSFNNPSKRFKRFSRGYRKTSFKGCFQGDQNHPRGSLIHAAPPSLYLRHA